ncbi:hypothetical protein EJA71_00385 [Pseudomonas sp. PB106]|nr:hypothetical protein EJA71_00385 [Pseudomonas sp. PB106]
MGKSQAVNGADSSRARRVYPIVPTLRVGMQPGTLRVPSRRRNAERPWWRSHAERGNDHLATR